MSSKSETTIPELARVRLLREVGPMEAGNVGTVVHVYPRSEAYEVEFRTGPGPLDWHFQMCLSDSLEVVNV